MEKLVLAVDLGGTNFRAAAIDTTGKIVKRIKKSSQGGRGKQPLWEGVHSALEHLYRDFPPGHIKAMGLAVAGAIDAHSGVITHCPNIVALEGCALREKLRSGILAHLPLILENDANAAAMGEKWKGAGAGCKDLICLTLGTGIGGGIIVDHSLVHGADGMAGELGHMTIKPRGPRCACGNHGCLEALASATALRREAIAAARKHPESSLNRCCRGDLAALDAELVSQEATRGDTIARRLYQVMGTHLGIGIANLINAFNPEAVIIGGGVSRAWELFIPQVRQEVQRRAFKVPAERAKILRAECGDDAGVLGAAYLALTAEASLTDHLRSSGRINRKS
jgi:glucokinase